MTIRRILHATDFSPRSRSAMEFSLMLARLLDARVDVLHVTSGVGPHRIDEYEAPSGDAEMSERGLRRTDGFDSLRCMAEGMSISVRFLVGRGSLPGPVILEEAQRGGANLIVLGAHGGGDAEANKLGSVSTDIVRRSTCPVLIIPPHVSEGAADAAMERVVTFISYTHLIEPVVGVAVQLAELLGARLDVLVQVGGIDPNRTVASWEEIEENLRAILERYEQESGVMLPAERIALHPVQGNVVDAVLTFTNDHSSHILILEAPGLASMTSPSEQAVEEMVGRSPCPVILVNTCGRPSAPVSGPCLAEEEYVV